MTVNQDAARRLAQEMVEGEGVHQLNTLSPAKVRVLTVVHDLNRPCATDTDLADALGWTRQYVYRLANELAEQGILVRQPGWRTNCVGRPATLYQCICATNREGDES